jgi:hypothetical protein
MFSKGSIYHNRQYLVHSFRQRTSQARKGKDNLEQRNSVFSIVAMASTFRIARLTTLTILSIASTFLCVSASR